MKIFVDTCAFCAISVPGDSHNARAKEIFFQVKDQGHVFTSNFVLDELYTLLNARSGHRQAVLFMDTFAKTGITLLKVTDAIESDAAMIFRKHDTPRLSYTDCTSFALINAHRLDHAFSFDSHFSFFSFDHSVKILGA